jgi:hypothetical protein
MEYGGFSITSVSFRERPPGTPGRPLCYLSRPLRRGFKLTIFRYPLGCLVNFAQTGFQSTRESERVSFRWN